MKSLFKSKFNLPYPLLADSDKVIAKKYEVLGSFFTKRHTFVIDPDGKIAKIFTKVNVSKHADEVLEAIAGMKATAVK